MIKQLFLVLAAAAAPAIAQTASTPPMATTPGQSDRAGYDTPSAMLQGKVTGPAEQCIATSLIRKTRIVSDQVILFQVGNRWMRSDLPERCVGLKPSSGLADRSSGNTLCAGNPFSFYQPGEAARAGIIQSGCNYGPFSPYELPKNPAG
jgi:hypothetical protein